MSANNKQIAGNHYKVSYQHWDMLAGMGYSYEYYIGQVSKYITRWRKKNGAQDVRKAQHFAEKLLELYDDTVAKKADESKFLPLANVSTTDAHVTMTQHKAGHLDRYFDDNEVGPRERYVMELMFFAFERDAYAIAIKVLDTIAREAEATADARGASPASTMPVSATYDFIGYSEDCGHATWRCHCCRDVFTLQVDQPPVYFHTCNASHIAQALAEQTPATI